MIVVLLVWLFLAPLGAWVIGAGIRVAEQRRVVVEIDDAVVEPACQQSDELLAVGA